MTQKNSDKIKNYGSNLTYYSSKWVKKSHVLASRRIWLQKKLKVWNTQLYKQTIYNSTHYPQNENSFV